VPSSKERERDESSVFSGAEKRVSELEKENTCCWVGVGATDDFVIRRVHGCCTATGMYDDIR
jgi:hypothetical protein